MASQFSYTNSALKKLTIDDLALLCNTLNPVAPKCFELGLQLGVKEAKIRIIITNNKNDCEAQLREIITKRLKQDMPLTWDDIATVLRSPSVNHPDLIRQIESEYISPSLEHLSSEPQHNMFSDSQEHSSSELMKTESSHMATHTTHSIQVPVLYSSNPTLQTHTPLIHSHSVNSMGTGQPLYQPLQQCPSQPPPLLNTNRYTLSPSHPSFHSYHQYQPLLHESQIQPHIPPQYTSPHHPSIYPFPQWQHLLPPQPLHIPSSSFHQSLPSSNMSRSSSLVSSRSSLQCTQQASIYPPSIVPSHTVPHEQPPSTQTGLTTPYRHMYPYQIPPHQAACCTMPYTPQPHPTSSHTKAPTKPLQEGVVVCQWDSASYMSHSQPQASHTQSLRQSGISALGSSVPSLSQLEYVRPSTQFQAIYHQSQNTSGGVGTPPAKTTGIKSPMDLYIDFVKDIYRQSIIEKGPSVLKWPPTPSEVFINLACIDRRTIVGKEEADEYTRAMIEDGNIDVIKDRNRL